MTPVKRAILLTAGYGSRLWPLTKVLPKSMMSIVDKPVIQYILDEIVASGIKEVVIVTGPDRSFNLFHEFIDHEIINTYKNIDFIFRAQTLPRGMLDAVQIGILDDEPTAVVVGDDIMISATPVLKQLIEGFKSVNKPIFSLYKVSAEEAHKYGMIKGEKSGNLYRITDVIEKPATREIPSNFSVFGRYILTQEIFPMIKTMRTDGDRELFLPDVFRAYMKNGGLLYGKETRGDRFDAGSKIGLLKAQVYFGLKNKDTRDEFRSYLKKTIK